MSVFLIIGLPSSAPLNRVPTDSVRLREWPVGPLEGLDIFCNSDMRVAKVRQFCKLDETGDSLVCQAMNQLNLSTRGNHQVLKLARMITGLTGSEDVQPVYLFVWYIEPIVKT